MVALKYTANMAYIPQIIGEYHLAVVLKWTINILYTLIHIPIKWLSGERQWSLLYIVVFIRHNRNMLIVSATRSGHCWDDFHATVALISAYQSFVVTPGVLTLIARFVGPTWGASGADRTQMGPMLAPWTLLCGYIWSRMCLGISTQPYVIIDL